MQLPALFAALSMGLLGSLHCAGMCGPIMLILPFRQMSGWRKVAGVSLYHLGRISTYALLGLLFHSFKLFFHPRWQQYISVGLGSILLLAGILSFFTGKYRLRLPWLQSVKSLSARMIGRPGLLPLFFSGVLNGMLPCGLVYMALSLAVTATNPASAMLCMYAFGAGTLPMLLLITLLGRKLAILHHPFLRKQVPVLLLAFGGLFLLRGMNLGIPYLSPKVVESGHNIHSSCCHPGN